MSDAGREHDRSWARRAGVVLLVLVLLGGAADLLGRQGLLDRFLDSDHRPTSALAVSAPDDLELPPARAGREVLAQPSGGRVSAADVRQRLLPLIDDRRFGRRIGIAVHDLTSDAPVLQIGASPFMPASTVKLLTGAAALEVLGPTHRFETSVTSSMQLARASKRLPLLTLVGGGDPLLVATRSPDSYPRPATLHRLVTDTSRALLDAGVRRVRIGFDDSLFTGPAVSPAWENDYVPDVTTPVSALSVDEGRDPRRLTRSTDPGALAARLFAQGLRKRGIRIAGTEPQPAPPGRVSVASVQSPPLDQVVASVLGLSDNEAAELLLRHIGLATGRGASFMGGAAGVREALRPLGVPWSGVRLLDGSGLARSDRLTLEALMAVLRLGADDSRPELRAVLGGLPVAGFDGTLVSRYTARGTSDALGLVRAKTGTLTGTQALAGTVVDADGVLLGFVAIANGVATRNTLFARDQLDRITAALAGCGCRR